MGAATVLLVALLAATAARGGGYPCNMAARLAEAGRAVSTWTPSSGVSPWELSQLEEGDIMQLRTVVTNQTLTWPNKRLPFIIERSDFTEEEVAKIEATARELSNLSCLSLQPMTHPEQDYVRVTGKATGCWSQAVGRRGGEQIINLQPPNCLKLGDAAHEFLHAIGFHHTHNSPYRDDYIRIIWENVNNETAKGYFRKHGAEATELGVPYDYNSLMHTSRRAHSINGRDTVETHDTSVTIGLKLKPSRYDIIQLKELYCRARP